jgi:hypothetical protein
MRTLTKRDIALHNLKRTIAKADTEVGQATTQREELLLLLEAATGQTTPKVVRLRLAMMAGQKAIENEEQSFILDKCAEKILHILYTLY